MNDRSIIVVLILSTIVFAALNATDGAERTWWSIRKTSSADKVQLTLEKRKLMSRWRTSTDVPVDSLKGLTPVQRNSLHANVRFEVAREPGTLVCEGFLTFGAGSGTFTFRPNPDFAAAMRKLGYDDPWEDRLFSMFARDLTLDFARAVQRAGVYANTGDLIALLDRNIDAGYLEQAAALGYRDFSARDFIRLHDHGVKLAYLRDMRDAGYKLSADELTRLQDHGVGASFAREVNSNGYRLRPDELIKLRDHGVRTDLLKAARDPGFNTEELVKLQDHGVSGDFLEELGKTRPGLSAEEIVRLKDHGVRPSYLVTVREARRDGVSVDDVIRLHDHGVPADFLQQVASSSYSNAGIHEVIKMRDNGVSGDYLKRLEAAGMKNLTVDQVIKLKQHGID